MTHTSELWDVDRELRQAIAELEMISHASTMNFGQEPRRSSDEPGGKRPSGGDADRPSRSASNDEKQAWFESYHRKTSAYFIARRLRVFDALGIGAPEWESSPERFAEASAHAVHGIEILRDECRSVLEAWRRRPLVNGQAPAKADPEWKRYIAECGRPSVMLATEYGCSQRYINRLKLIDWSALDETEPERARREREEWERRRAA